jgi:hypothetical protein
MKTTVLGLSMCVFVLALIPGCATIKPSIWPESPENYSIWYNFQPVPSVEEAVANIKNLQNNLFFDRKTASSIEIDKFSVRAFLKWTEQQYVNTSSSTYGPGDWFAPSYKSYGTSVVAENKEKTSIIPLKEIKSITLFANNGVFFWLNSSAGIWVQADNAYNAKKFADSVFTLAKVHKIKLAPGIGLSIANLNDEQKEELELKDGILVTDVARKGPADKAGMEFGDIILEINGDAVHTIEDFWGVITDGAPAKIRIMKFSRDKDTGKINFVKKTVNVTPISQ